MLAVVVVVAAVPEGLPMSVALSLSLAMRKMTMHVKAGLSCDNF